ncbi:MAG: hypothetical protein WKF88_07400 [Ferruginibacter sp.]
MTGLKFFPILYVLTAMILSFCACSSKKEKKDYKDSESFAFSNPKILELPEVLDEISGIAYYEKDTSIFAVIDEDGVLFKVPLSNPKKVKEWHYDKARDYEDLILKDSIFYVLVSNGELEKLKFEGDKISVEKVDYPNSSKKVNEFETLYFDSASGKIVTMCKDCEDDKKARISSFFLNDSLQSFSPFSCIESSTIFLKAGIAKEHIKPSAAAVQPITKELYVLCSVNKLMLVFGPAGNILEVIKLNPSIYKQPEGMCFTPEGNLIISNEFNQKGFANLLLLKNKKKP